MKKKIKDFQKLKSDEVKEDILEFLQKKTDVPIKIDVRNTSNTFYVKILPQISFQDFINCKYSRWNLPIQIYRLDTSISEHLGFSNTEYRGWTFSTSLIWHREIGNYVTKQNEKLRNELNIRDEELFAVRVDYFLCSKTPIITVGSEYNTYLNHKIINKRIKDVANKVGIENPQINYLQGNYWLAKQAYNPDYKEYWDKEKLFDFFEKNAINKFGNIYQYNIDKFTDLDEPAEVFCNQHGVWFTITPKEHLNGKRCPYDNESKGESMVRVFLEKRGINLKQYHRIKECFSEVNGKCYTLPFDFFLSDLNILIEYDGEQHYRPVDMWGGEEGFKRQQVLDSIKNKFAERKGIKLIRIPYTVKKENQLSEYLTNDLLGIGIG